MISHTANAFSVLAGMLKPTVKSLFRICSLLKIKGLVARWFPIAGMSSLLVSMALMLRAWRLGMMTKRNRPTHDDLERQEVHECSPDLGDQTQPLLPSGS